MGSYLIRVESTNISAFLSDTQELSVVRGASYSLLRWTTNAINQLKSNIGDENVDVVTSGSSALTIVIDECTKDSAKEILQSLLNVVRSDEVMKYATFAGAVAVIDPDGYALALNTAVSSIRLQQQQQVDIGLPPVNEDTSETRFCQMNRVFANDNPKGSLGAVSDFSWRRFQAGRAAKKDYVKRISNRDVQSTNDLEQLTSGSDFAKSLSDGGKNLSQYMAVIMFDGNQFGQLESKAAHNSSLGMDNSPRGVTFEAAQTNDT